MANVITGLRIFVTTPIILPINPKNFPKTGSFPTRDFTRFGIAPLVKKLKNCPILLIAGILPIRPVTEPYMPAITPAASTGITPNNNLPKPIILASLKGFANSLLALENASLNSFKKFSKNISLSDFSSFFFNAFSLFCSLIASTISWLLPGKLALRISQASFIISEVIFLFVLSSSAI